MRVLRLLETFPAEVHAAVQDAISRGATWSSTCCCAGSRDGRQDSILICIRICRA